MFSIREPTKCFSWFIFIFCFLCDPDVIWLPFTSAPDCLLHSVQSKLLWACACMLPDGDGAPFCIRSHLNDCEVDLKTSRQIRDFPPQRFSSGHTKGLPIGIILSFVLLTSMKLPSLVYVLLNFCLTFFLALDCYDFGRWCLPCEGFIQLSLRHTLLSVMKWL